MELELFMFDGCPYCAKVIREIEAQDRDDIEIYDIHEDNDARERLIEEGGKEQVPCLFIDGEALYESNDIIQFLRDNPQ